MGFRFQRRVSIIPGLRLNLSKSGASLSIGHRGAWYTIGPRGRRVTLGLPGTGLSWTDHVPPAALSHAAPAALPAPPARRFYLHEPIPPAAPVHGGHRAAFAIVVVAIALALIFLAASSG